MSQQKEKNGDLDDIYDLDFSDNESEKAPQKVENI